MTAFHCTVLYHIGFFSPLSLTAGTLSPVSNPPVLHFSALFQLTCLIISMNFMNLVMFYIVHCFVNIYCVM